MSVRARLSIQGQLRLALNPGLSQSIAMLRMDAASLASEIEREAAENPYLDLLPASPPAPTDWLPRWMAHSGTGEAPELASAGASLISHVLAHVAGLGLGGGALDFAHLLADALDPSGWLSRPLASLAAEAELPLTEAEAILAAMQRIEPAGLFARGLAECLRLQARAAGELDEVMAGILDNLGQIASGRGARLARKLGISPATLERYLARIRAYDPKPGTRFDPLMTVPGREPDLILTETTRHAGQGDWSRAWTVRLNGSALPGIAVRSDTARDRPEALARARQLAGVLRARNETLLSVAELVVRRQGAAIALGASHLLPLTMAEVAADLGLHESTVSRIVQGSAMEGPRGTVWLRALFSPEALRLPDGRSASAAALRAAVLGLIAAEDPRAPLRDEALATALLEGTGIALSRRTIAAYRQEAGIPIAGQRRRRSAAKMPGIDPIRRLRG